MSEQFRRDRGQRHSGNRHALGRRRDVRLGHRPLHRRFVVFATSRCRAAYTRPGSGARARDRRRFRQGARTRQAIDAYLAEVDIPGAIRGHERQRRRGFGGLRGEYLAGLALCFEAMWDLAMEMLGKGDPVPYERCVRHPRGQAPEPSDPVRETRARGRTARLRPADRRRELLAAVDAWRKAQRVPMASVERWARR